MRTSEGLFIRLNCQPGKGRDFRLERSDYPVAFSYAVALVEHWQQASYLKIVTYELSCVASTVCFMNMTFSLQF